MHVRMPRTRNAPPCACVHFCPPLLSLLHMPLHLQTQTEWIDMDMELERLLNGSYQAVKDLLARNRYEGCGLPCATCPTHH